jgi:hypothetical protein
LNGVSEENWLVSDSQLLLETGNWGQGEYGNPQQGGGATAVESR